MQLSRTEYQQTFDGLEKSGIIVSLTRSSQMGILGFDGEEYPAPSFEQLSSLWQSNRVLIDYKTRQGFSQLLLTPLAAPITTLLAGVDTMLRELGSAGILVRARETPSASQRPVVPNKKSTAWIWEKVNRQLDSPELVYFPKNYDPAGHHGMPKTNAVADKSICAVPGWSVGLIETNVFLPRPVQGKILAEQRQLDNELTPREHLEILKQPANRGETGWTLEDFLTCFLIRLCATNEVSYDRSDGNALWLLGNFLPQAVDYGRLVLTAFWCSEAGRKLYISAHRSGNKFQDWGARTVVRFTGN
jgi:hypothetical protein